MLPCKSWYWDMHGLIFETSIWLLAGSTRLVELHTNRAAKHRYGKQRCKTSNMTVSYENMNLQIRSMFDAEPTSAELISSRKRFVKRPCHQWNTQASNATHASMALEKRTPNTTHPRSSRIAPARKRWQFNQARRDAKTPIREIAKKKKSPPPVLPKKPKKRTLHRSRVPAYTHNLMTTFDISVELRHLFQKNWTDLGACFDHTHISQTWYIWNDNLHPTSTTRHMDRPWNQPEQELLLSTEICWKSRCSFFF